MIKLCEFIEEGNGYHDIVLYDTESKKMFILDSIIGNTKFNGQTMNVSETEQTKLHDLEEWEFKTEHFFGEGESEVTIDDLKETRTFTVVINNEMLMSKNNHEDSRIYTFNFKSNKIDSTTTSDHNDFDFDSIDIIKPDLKFIKKIVDPK